MNIETPKQLIQAIKTKQFSVHQQLRLLRSQHRFYNKSWNILFLVFCLYTFFNYSISLIISFIWIFISISWLIHLKTNAPIISNCEDALIKLKFIRDTLQTDKDTDFNFMLLQYQEVIESFN
jgi:hypothetical protein